MGQFSKITIAEKVHILMQIAELCKEHTGVGKSIRTGSETLGLLLQQRREALNMSRREIRLCFIRSSPLAICEVGYTKAYLLFRARAFSLSSTAR